MRRVRQGVLIGMGIMVIGTGVLPQGWAQKDDPPPSPSLIHGFGLIREGQVADGIRQIAQVVDADAHEPAPYLASASLLFYRGQYLLRAGNTADAELVFREVERQLAAALALPSTNGVLDELAKSQAAHLLGDVYQYVFKDSANALASYQEALRLNPEHPAALEAMKRLQP